MLWSEYMDEVKSDAMDAIKENLEYNDSWDEMYDSLTELDEDEEEDED